MPVLVPSSDVRVVGSRSFLDVRSYGAAGDGVTDDTTALRNAIAAVPAGGTLYAPGGTYLTDSFPRDLRMRILGDGKELTTFKAKTGATGPFVSCNGAAYRPGYALQGFTVDLTNAATIAGVYLHQVRNGHVTDVRVDHGTVGIQLDKAQAMRVIDCEAYDCSTSGFLGSDSASSGNIIQNFLVDQTTVGCTACFDLTAGIDWWLVGCSALRAPGGAFNVSYGYRAAYSVANYTATIKLLGCTADAISDRTSDSATVASLYMQNVGSCDITDSWLDAYSQTDATSNPAVKIDGCKDLRFVGNRMGGRGVTWAGAASSGMRFTGNGFLDGVAGTNLAMYVLPAANPPTLVSEVGSYQDVNSTQNLQLANVFSRWQTATGGTYGN